MGCPLAALNDVPPGVAHGLSPTPLERGTGGSFATCARLAGPLQSRLVRLLFLVTYYYPHWTGLTAYARRIAEAMARRGHSVHALTTQYDPALPRQEVVHGVLVHRVPAQLTVSRSAIGLGLLPELWRLLPGTDAVSIHIPFPEVLPATVLARARGSAVFITHNGDLVLPGGLQKPVLEGFYYLTTYLAGRLATAVIPQTQDYARSSKLLSPLWPKLRFVYAPVDLPPPDAASAAAWRKELGLADRFVIGFAGRFVEEKGFDYLLMAVPEIVRRIPNAHFVFAGERDIPYERFFDANRHLLAAHEDRFTFLGLIRDRQRMADFYGLIDLFALPSRSDCFPSTQIEAVRAGTPVVAADIPGAREIVRVTGMGELVRPRDPAALAEGIARVASNLETYRQRRELALRTFDPEKTYDAYEALFAGSPPAS